MPPRASSSPWAHRAERALLVGGVVLLGVLVSKVGLRAVLDDFRLVGWGIVPILLQELTAYVFNTIGWRYAFAAPPPEISFMRLLAIRLAGDAINSVTPTATLGGEVLRVRLLRDRMAAAPAMASVTIAMLGQTVAQALFVAAGFALLLAGSSLPAGMRPELLVGAIVMGGLAVVLVVAQRRGRFSPLVAGLRLIGLERLGARLRPAAARLDGELAAFHAAGAGRFALSVASFVVGWASGLLEVALILFFLRIPVSVERVLAIEVLSIAIDGLLFFVPAKIGTQEGGKVLIFTLLGLPPAQGLVFGLLRRVRELAWAAAGLTLLSRLQSQLAPPSTPA
jgi:uncharacterized protein (TIRG00374 family)